MGAFLSIFFVIPDHPISNATLSAIVGDCRSGSLTRRLRELRSPRYGAYEIRSARDHSGLASDEFGFRRKNGKSRRRSKIFPIACGARSSLATRLRARRAGSRSVNDTMTAAL